ncbi:flagellar hook capping protein [Paenibacillus sp. N1-5-1-14]|uniref:flagellar hook capping FlgD N-terminal domain-containing protein n=1 Tax=Paenibacillus radicibacter TaxID=2972488 RepID=UPI002158B527|nr:flagellar hook capping FlgD N-terminal domain-containing protein [Paenibacillus radicibacter]MCR8642188.1 flagellar hook capping protein [Paenibacillus radicibacter]
MADSLFVNPKDVIGKPASGQPTKKEPGSVLGKDDFLKLLITQLRNQDAMQPMQDKEFIAQMAQFTSVEQLGNMTSELKLLRQSLGSASSLIGKSVTWMTQSETGELAPKSGVVDSILIRGGVQYASVKGEEIPLDKVVKIENDNPKTNPEDANGG